MACLFCMEYHEFMFVLVTYVPESHLSCVKEALFKAGAGAMGSYDSCCWQVKGRGQFRPLAGSHPFLGSENKMEEVDEWRLELVVDDAHAKAAVEALLQAHPYEVPAYHLIPVVTYDDLA